ncbi:MAG: TonB-dependent receptor [Gemmatimonadales bacterium]
MSQAPITLVLIGMLAGVAARASSAQVPVIPAPADTGKADSLHRRPDTLSTTDRLLKAQKEQAVQRNVLPLPGTGTLQPVGTRIILTRDSIEWAAAEDLGELLGRVPAVYLERGGWIGSPVLPNYLGHGAASVEYVLDGQPQIAVGPDSVAFDPSTLPLEFLDRVEIETSAGMMRVLLFTRRHDRQAPRTKIGASQGDRSLARYFGDFERRYSSGIGVGVAADYLNINSSSAGSGGATIPSAWLQLGYIPSARFGVQGQYIVQSIQRDLLLGTSTPLLGSPTIDTLSRQENAKRTDAQLRASWRAHDDGSGASVDLFAAHTEWTSDSAPGNEGIGEFGGIATLRHSTWTAQLNTWHYTRWTSLDSRLDLGWAPLSWVAGSVQLVAQRHDGDRRSQWATGRLGLTLPWGFHVAGSISDGHRVQSPSLADERAQRFTDAQVTAGFDSRRLTLEVGVARDDDWQPLAYPEFVAVPSYLPLPQTDWFTVHARLAPVGWFTLETAFQNPRTGLPDGVPPKHALSTATIRSRFLRNFPHGIFELKLQAIVESWSPGIGGRDSVGAAIQLPGASQFRTMVQMKLGPFFAYWDRVNLQSVKIGSVPGYPIQPLGSTFGIRWEFSN